MSRHLYELRSRISGKVANAAGHPVAQIGVLAVCAATIAIGGTAAENALTLVLSVASITLTQMVLNQQKRHDAALHLKIDELIYAKTGARDEIAGIEGASEEELEALRRRGDVAEDVLEARAQTGKPRPTARSG